MFRQTYVTLKDLNDTQSFASVLRSYNERSLNRLMCCEECTVRLGSLVVVSVDTIRFNIVFYQHYIHLSQYLFFPGKVPFVSHNTDQITNVFLLFVEQKSSVYINYSHIHNT